MISISKNYPCIELIELPVLYSFNGTKCTNRHKDGSFDFRMCGKYYTSTCFAPGFGTITKNIKKIYLTSSQFFEIDFPNKVTQIEFIDQSQNTFT